MKKFSKKICEMCGRCYLVSNKANKSQKYCGSWRRKKGCSWIYYRFRIGTHQFRQKFVKFIRTNYPRILSEFYKSLVILTPPMPKPKTKTKSIKALTGSHRR